MNDPTPAGRIALLAATALLAACPLRSQAEEAGSAVSFAQAEIVRAAAEAGAAAPRASFGVDTALAPQAYRISRSSQGGYRISGGDATGEMYGGLDLAEALRLGTAADLSDAVHLPYIRERGIKFNLPLDVRTPSYSDNGDSFQANIPEVWSASFWHALLDEMARDRYNVLSLWSLHPFPSLVKVPEFPDIALDDVWRTKAKLDDTFSTNGTDMVRPYMLENHEVVARMSIGEKIQFWRGVMDYARSRGIEVYLFTWNIFVWGAEGKHGITSDQDNPETIAYMRDSVRETVLTYPLLAGIGITAGEHMDARLAGALSRENWLWRTYGLGVADALKREPGRRFLLIHRLHQTDPTEIFSAFRDYPGPLDLEFKYSIAHMYSLPNPPFIQELLPYLSPSRKTWVTLRNDDIHTFRWGDPDYARDYIRDIPPGDRIAGYLMGSDGYCWGREAIEREPDNPRQLVLQRQWYSFLLWGRLGYDPGLTDGHFERVLGARYPGVSARDLYAASNAASRIIPQVTRFFWGDIDIKWFPELCTRYPTPRGFYSVRDFMLGNTMPGSGILDIRKWRDCVLAKSAFPGMTPPQVAGALSGWVDTTRALVGKLKPEQGNNRELRLTLGDYEALADLGAYYSEKIRGACDLALFDATRDPGLRESAARHLDAALGEWRRYAAVVNRQYVPQLLNRIGNSDPALLASAVAADIDIARSWKTGTLGPASAAEPAPDTTFRPSPHP